MPHVTHASFGPPEPITQTASRLVKPFSGDHLENGSPYPIRPLSDCLPVLSETLVYCGQTVGLIRMPLVMEVGLGQGHGHIVLGGDSAPPPQKNGTQQPPHFSVHVYCGQTTGWIRMPLGMEIGLHPGHTGHIMLCVRPSCFKIRCAVPQLK